MTPLVYIVVLNYNGAMCLDDCLRSIGETTYGNLRVVVVDNASTDGSATLAERYRFELLQSTRNLGWSGGNNLGIRRAQAAGARYVVLANNDIRVDPRWIAEAVRVAEASRDIAVVGFQVYERSSTGADAGTAFANACAAWSRVQLDEPKYVGGMSMLVRTEMFDALGLIDEHFFAYGEENDFQLRVRAAGYRVVAINVPVWHYGQASFARQPFRAALLQTENNIQLLLKHASPATIVRAALRHVLRRCVRIASQSEAGKSDAGKSETAKLEAADSDAGKSDASKSETAKSDRSPVEARLAPGSGLYNAGLLGLAALHLSPKVPAILRRRAEDKRRVAAALAASCDPPRLTPDAQSPKPKA